MTSTPSSIATALTEFEKQISGVGKGGLALLLVITERAKAESFPLNPQNFLTDGGGQVAGAGGAAANKILKAHGVKVSLSSEGGRTNRGSISLMQRYIQCLNDFHSKGKKADLSQATLFWVRRIESFLASAPFKAKLGDKQISIRSLVNDLLAQSQAKQKSRPGSTITGTVMQHLTAAKLRCLLSDAAPKPHGASDADTSRSTEGDFEVKDAVLHVTAAPTSQLLEKCKRNLDSGRRPIIITLTKSLTHAQSLAEELGVENRLEFWAFDQFISTNAHEWGGFLDSDVRDRARALFQTYNDIIEELHEEPSLCISF